MLTAEEASYIMKHVDAEEIRQQVFRLVENIKCTYET